VNGPIPWIFNSIHSHCQDDVNSILNISKNFGLSGTSAAHSKETGSRGNPPGILDVFFLKISDHSSLYKTEFIYLKFLGIINRLTQQISTVGVSSIPYLVSNLDSFFVQNKSNRSDGVVS
jgi:hypothetical protein